MARRAQCAARRGINCQRVGSVGAPAHDITHRPSLAPASERSIMILCCCSPTPPQSAGGFERSFAGTLGVGGEHAVYYASATIALHTLISRAAAWMSASGG